MDNYHMKRYNDRITYCSLVISLLFAGYLAAASIARGESVGAIIGNILGSFIVFSAILLLVFFLIGENMYPEDKNPSPIGIRILVIIGAAVVGFLFSSMIHNI
jgi:hypothetical protein